MASLSYAKRARFRSYHKKGWPTLIRVDYHGSREVPTGTCFKILKDAGIKGVPK